MARTKKTVTNTDDIKKEEQVETSNKPEVSATSNVGIGYQGKIDVRIMKGNKTISKKSYHNAGYTDLFKFLYDCLVGEYQKLNRPCKIKLYNKDADEKPGSVPVLTEGLAVTPYAISTVHAGVDLINGTEYAAVFEFKIPFTYITDAICKAALFPNTIITQTEGEKTVDINKYATFEFVDDNNNWAPIDRQSAVGNYSLQLTWTMTFKNVSSTTN